MASSVVPLPPQIFGAAGAARFSAAGRIRMAFAANVPGGAS
jgi:hypothetical protein